MQKYFGIFFEFNHDKFRATIEWNLRQRLKGYVCMVDANVLTIAQKDQRYQKIINNSLVNSCDGSSIAMLAGMIYKQNLRALNGPDIFSYYVEKEYSQLLLGSDLETCSRIKDVLKKKGVSNNHISVLPLPFLNVNDFDYQGIARQINESKPEIIWVSLGAPKQEIFMANLLPYIDAGVMFGIGAAFNFYVGKISLPGTKVGALKFIWLSRIFREPGKQISRVLPYLKILPKLYFQEKRRLGGKM